MAGSSRAVNFESMFKAMSMVDRAIAIASSRIAAQHKRMAEIADASASAIHVPASDPLVRTPFRHRTR
ncbi:hypothetical protein GGD41_004107 [Paraburkholderia bryophila]|uniref:Uncharacterized protein n=1 Tax=Paraburkholderia bryophila TaxID=420952 RepID=A0A7Z0B0Q5_9BURK|nr:hypothetical protein [Paraburkholderia bryophila]